MSQPPAVWMHAYWIQSIRGEYTPLIWFIAKWHARVCNDVMLFTMQTKHHSGGLMYSLRVATADSGVHSCGGWDNRLRPAIYKLLVKHFIHFSQLSAVALQHRSRWRSSYNKDDCEWNVLYWEHIQWWEWGSVDFDVSRTLIVFK